MLPHYTEINQLLNSKPEYKEKYGDVHTPFSLIEQMIEDLPQHIFYNPNLKWLDPCAGRGYYFMVVYAKLMDCLVNVFEDDNERSKHILQNMLYSVEINPENIEYYKSYFSQNNNKINLFECDFLSTTREMFGFSQNNLDTGFDIVIGNPPYNINGFKKVPTQQKREKKNDGVTSWGDFIRHSIFLSKKGSICSMIVPSIWMKPDKAMIYDYLTSFISLKIKTFTNTETNKIFNKQAQTPTCYFSLINNKFQDNFEDNNINTDNNIVNNIVLEETNISLDDTNKKLVVERNIQLFCNIQDKYVNYLFDSYSPIPLSNISLISDLNKLRENECNNQRLSQFISKSMMPSKNNTISTSTISLNNKDNILQNINDNYLINERKMNIKTCIFENKVIPSLIIQESQEFCKYFSQQKIIMAHKMFGIPFFDYNGTFGISNRDNYVLQINSSSIIPFSNEKLREKYLFYMWLLSTPLVRLIFDTTRYRMRYLEKYAFELIPDLYLCETIHSFWRENIHNKFLSLISLNNSNSIDTNITLFNDFIQTKLIDFSQYIIHFLDTKYKNNNSIGLLELIQREKYSYQTFILQAYQEL